MTSFGCAAPVGTCPGRLAAAGLLFAIAVSGGVSGQQTQSPVPSVLQSIRVVPPVGGGSVVVILEADGPLPEPVSDALGGPPRVYLDLTGVRPGASLARTGSHALIVRTRVARHSENPVVTRVVLDLSRPAAYRIDASARAQGRLLIVLEAGSAPSTGSTSPTATTAPRASTPAVRPRPPLAGSSTRARAAAGRAEAYAAQLSVAVERLQALRPVLVSIDRFTDVADDLAGAAAEFEAIGRLLNAVKPPAPREATHGLLVRVCDLGARSARTLQESIRSGDVTGQRNASSAAAGALILLDRAIKDLGVQ